MTGSEGTDHLRDGPVVINQYCEVAKPIFWSLNDTDETILAVKQHNASYAKLCDGGL